MVSCHPRNAALAIRAAILAVLAGIVPAVHVLFFEAAKTWMPAQAGHDVSNEVTNDGDP
jgi:hypothetical protein